MNLLSIICIAVLLAAGIVALCAMDHADPHPRGYLGVRRF